MFSLRRILNWLRSLFLCLLSVTLRGKVLDSVSSFDARFYSAFASGMSFIGRLLDGLKTICCCGFPLASGENGQSVIMIIKYTGFLSLSFFFPHEIIRSIRFQHFNVFRVCHFYCATGPVYGIGP